MRDDFEASGKRQRLINELRQKGIADDNVLEAMSKIPRHLFIDTIFLSHAYVDKAFPIDSGQTISQPSTVAIQTTLLKVKEWDKILEIGTGSGYQSAVLAEMGAKVYTIERQRALYEKDQKTLKALGYKTIQFFYGDGYKGKPLYGPFDGIIITAAIKEIPQTLIDQLKVGGRLVAPIGQGDSQIMTCMEKQADGSCISKTYGDCAFVPMLSGTK